MTADGPRVHVIANPAAGRGSTIVRLEVLESRLRAAGCRLTRAMTAAPGDAQRLARVAGPDVDILVVAGGDGTIADVLNGLPSPRQTPIAILATGGANVLVRELGLPRRPEDLAALVMAAHTRSIDLGRLDSGRLFATVLSAGFDASVVRRVQERRRGRLGMRGFVLPAVRTAIGHRSPRLEVTVDDARPLDCALAVVANTRTYAGIMQVADNASCDSGCLEVVLFPHASALSLPRYGWAALRGRVSHLPGVKCMPARRITIAGPADVQADGEYLGSTPLTVTVEPRAATFVVP